MHVLQSPTLELTGMLWLQPEQQCPAWETWDRISQTLSGQQVTPTAWAAPPPPGCILSPEFSVSIECEPGSTSQRRIPRQLKRSPHWTMSMARYGGTPWKAPDKVYEYSVDGLTEEIEDFFEFIEPKPMEKAVREFVIDRIRSVIIEKWPHAEVDVFGSFCTGLYLPTSDIDIVVKGDWNGIPPLYDLERVVYEKGVAQPGSVLVLDKATVPLVKFRDILTDMKIDITFNQINCTDSARFVNRCCQLFPCLKKLAFVFKQFVSDLHLNEVFVGGLSSYSLILMILSFLQRHPERDVVRDPNVNLGILLMDILLYYGKRFDYDNYGIRIRGGGSIVERAELRDSLNSNAAPGSLATMTNAHGMLIIEDPLTPGNDVARSSYKYNQVREAFQLAYDVLDPVVHPILSRPFGETLPGHSILGRIIRIPDAAADRRAYAFENEAMIELYDPYPVLSSSPEPEPDIDLDMPSPEYEPLAPPGSQIAQAAAICWEQYLEQNCYVHLAPQPIMNAELCQNGHSDCGGHERRDQESTEDETSSRAESPS